MMNDLCRKKTIPLRAKIANFTSVVSLKFILYTYTHASIFACPGYCARIKQTVIEICFKELSTFSHFQQR